MRRPGEHPFGVALDPTGRFLFVVNKADNNVSMYAVDSATGSFTVSGSPFSGSLKLPTDICGGRTAIAAFFGKKFLGKPFL
jgi:6-phosphogluconolactonase